MVDNRHACIPAAVAVRTSGAVDCSHSQARLMPSLKGLGSPATTGIVSLALTPRSSFGTTSQSGISQGERETRIACMLPHVRRRPAASAKVHCPYRPLLAKRMSSALDCTLAPSCPERPRPATLFGLTLQNMPWRRLRTHGNQGGQW
jgi:hypothetical protein